MLGVLVKMRNLDTETGTTHRTPCKHESRYQGDASTGQGILDTASKPPATREEAWN